MLDVKVPGQALLELVQHAGQVSVVEAEVVHDDVCSQHRQAGGDLARVQVVYFTHMVDLEQMRADRAQLKSLGSRLQQDVDALAQQLQGARDDQHADEQRGQRVGS